MGPEEGYSIPELTDDVAALCAEVGIEKPVVVGHSLGGEAEAATMLDAWLECASA